MVTTQFFGENIESAAGVAIQSNGKIVVAGFVFSTFDPSFALARYNTDGSLDTNFGTGGKVTTDFGNPSDVGVLCPPGRKDCSEDFAKDVAINPMGRSSRSAARVRAHLRASSPSPAIWVIQPQPACLSAPSAQSLRSR
jgi:uncharacterized delta-60 repeat protein